MTGKDCKTSYTSLILSVGKEIFDFSTLNYFSEQVPLRPLARAHVNRVSKYTGEPALLTCVGLFTTEVTTVISWDFNGSQLNLDTDEHYKLDYVYYEEDLTPKVNFSLLIKEVTERDTGKYRCRVITPGWSASDMIFLSLVKPRKFTDHVSNTLARRDGVETGGSKLLTPFRTLHFQTPPFFLVFLLSSLRATSPPTDLSSPRRQRAQESLLAGYPPFNFFVDCEISCIVG